MATRDIRVITRIAGMTLIELLVVITILTTLVAGVIPLLSPNNDVRKLREASRGLQAFITASQSAAARTGRPHGIAFRETSQDSGVAIELFQLEVPPAFAGFSPYSSVRLNFPPLSVEGTITFGQGVYSGFVPDDASAPTEIPPGMIRVGDVIRVAGYNYRIVVRTNTTVQLIDGVPFVQPTQLVDADWVGRTEGDLTPDGARPYQIFRQPVNSTASPFQLPRAIGVDLVASGPNAVIPNSPDVDRPPQFGFTSIVSPLLTALNGGTKTAFSHASPITVGVMFEPSGQMGDVYINGERFDAFTQLHLLLGRVEFAASAPDIHGPPHFDFSGLSDSELEEKRKEYNWLDLDSRWVTVAGRTGRVITSENAFVDPRAVVHASDYPDANRALRIDFAREFAREMRQSGSN
ncbi:type II secretion system protein [Pirellulales bacterium]|nr:type II secretion system protein [Pirellulales bacterium]